MPSRPPDIPALNGRFLSPMEPPGRPSRRLALQSTEPEPQPELILGESNLLPFHFLRAGDRAGRAVVKIRRGDGACGTGFLVAPDVLLTNHHVLPDIETASRAVALGLYEADPPEVESVRRRQPIEAAIAPDILFVSEPELDFTFCGVLGLETLGTITLDRSDSGPGPSEVVNIIQHPRGRPKEVALRDNQVVKADGVVLHYVCDTEPGSSGSPVFDNEWRLVALHHASIIASDSTGGRRASGLPPESRFLNEGVRLSALARWLESDAAGPDEAGVKRIRRLFRGLDPRAGFFGAIGRSPGSLTMTEFVSAAESDHRGESLDVAAWDLRGMARRPLEDLGDLGAIMAAMGVDVWLLSHASAAQARTLAEHLATVSGRDHRLLPGPETLSVISRPARALLAERLDIGGVDATRVRVRNKGTGGIASIVLAPLPRGGSQAVVAALAALRGTGRSHDSLLIGGRHTLVNAQGQKDLSKLGLRIATAIGQGGGLVLARGTGARVGRVFATIGVEIESEAEVVRLVADRDLPEDAMKAAGRMPIIARIVLGGT